MLKKIHKMLSFKFSDLFGIFVGGALIFVCTNTELFYIVISPYFYLVMLLLVMLSHLWLWLLVYHGEMAYMKQNVGWSMGSYVRFVLATISTIGVYFLSQSVL